jgi:hypothetical protein
VPGLVFNAAELARAAAGGGSDGAGGLAGRAGRVADGAAGGAGWVVGRATCPGPAAGAANSDSADPMNAAHNSRRM